MDNNGYKVMVIAVIFGLIIGIIFGTLSCNSSNLDYIEESSSYYHPSEMAMEIDRLNNVINTKDNQIDHLNTAIGYLEEGGHVTVSIIGCDYENNLIRLNVNNRLPIQLEVKSIGVIENKAYTNEWYDDYSENATGYIPANGNLELIWNQSKAQTLDLDDNKNTIMIHQSNKTENDSFYQFSLNESESYSIRIECGDGIYCYTVLEGDEI